MAVFTVSQRQALGWNVKQHYIQVNLGIGFPAAAVLLGTIQGSLYT